MGSVISYRHWWKFPIPVLLLYYLCLVSPPMDNSGLRLCARLSACMFKITCAFYPKDHWPNQHIVKYRCIRIVSLVSVLTCNIKANVFVSYLMIMMWKWEIPGNIVTSVYANVLLFIVMYVSTFRLLKQKSIFLMSTWSCGVHKHYTPAFNTSNGIWIPF